MVEIDQGTLGAAGAFYSITPLRRIWIMKGNRRSIGVAAIAAAAIFMAGVPTFAHHPFDEEFDWTKPVTLAGTITRVGWDEPHATIAIQPRDQGPMRWLVELGSRRVLEKNTSGRRMW
jgi:hypothetical protein